MSESSPPRRALSGIRSRGPLVLLVEEDEVVRTLYAAELVSSGFMVVEAADGAEAIEMVAQYGPHAIVLDLMLPGVDGFKVARRLRAVDSEQDIAIVGLSSQKSETLALGAGCDAFLTKPVLGAALVGAIVRLLARRSRRAS